VPSGGERTGRPGTAYPNRSDLTSKRTYGDGRTQEAIRESTPNTAPSQNAPSGGPPPPGSLVPLGAPTERPGEPVTAGLPIGAGAGPEALTGAPVADDALYELRALAARFPSKDLDRIIALAEEEV
jgi:hypothetical protein